MIEIFIPVLLICVDSVNNCEFMQGKDYYVSEAKCEASLDVQKQYMLNLLKQAGQGKVILMEGTCVDAKIKTKGLHT